jgi:hypothetical protein
VELFWPDAESAIRERVNPAAVAVANLMAGSMTSENEMEKRQVGDHILV